MGDVSSVISENLSGVIVNSNDTITPDVLKAHSMGIKIYTHTEFKIKFMGLKSL